MPVYAVFPFFAPLGHDETQRDLYRDILLMERRMTVNEAKHTNRVALLSTQPLSNPDGFGISMHIG